MQGDQTVASGGLLSGQEAASQHPPDTRPHVPTDSAYNSTDIPELPGDPGSPAAAGSPPLCSSAENETRGRQRSQSLVFSGEQYIKIDEEATTPEEETRHGTLWSSVITLTTTAAGAGILTLPYALKDAGLVGGLATLMLCAVVSDYSMLQLVRASRQTGATSYRDVGVKTWGVWMGTVVDASMLALLLGASIVFVIIMVDSDSGFPAIFSRRVDNITDSSSARLD